MAKFGRADLGCEDSESSKATDLECLFSAVQKSRLLQPRALSSRHFASSVRLAHVEVIGHNSGASLDSPEVEV